MPELTNISLDYATMTVSRGTIVAHIPLEHGRHVSVILGKADGPLVTIDENGHIKVSPQPGPYPEQFKTIATQLVTIAKALSR